MEPLALALERQIPQDSPLGNSATRRTVWVRCLVRLCDALFAPLESLVALGLDIVGSGALEGAVLAALIHGLAAMAMSPAQRAAVHEGLHSGLESLASPLVAGLPEAPFEQFWDTDSAAWRRWEESAQY